MTVTYRTVVLHLPATPLGLLPERWAIEHWCSLCRLRVAPGQLVVHARDHGRDEHTDGDEPFQSRPTSGTLARINPSVEDMATTPDILRP